MPAQWYIRVDTGGTFTDCVARHVDGRCTSAKVLSRGGLRGRVLAVSGGGRVRLDGNWPRDAAALCGMGVRIIGRAAPSGRVAEFDGERGLARLDGIEPAAGDVIEIGTDEPAPILAARLATGTSPDRDLPPLDLRLATTKGTNALLEGRGARTAFFVTLGFRDLLVIGDQRRDDLFALAASRSDPLHASVCEVSERMDAAGSVVRPLDAEALVRAARAARADGAVSAAVAFMHAWRNPEHERLAARLLAEVGFDRVSVSSELAPLIGYVDRAQTAVVDAYLSPIISDYLESVQAGASGSRLFVMSSAGGLARTDRFRAKDSLLSGPAGGVTGAIEAARQCGFDHVLAFDMGGTSTDVSRSTGGPEYRFEHRAGPARLMTPALAIETVAAGGGSICGYDGDRLFVGPRSAGAEPGPACYGAGGPLTVTDLNLLLGRLDPTRFGVPISPSASREAMEAVVESMTGAGSDPDVLAAGLLDIANERMADAIRRVSTRRGYDPADHVLVAFGGAGPQHACGVATRLDMTTVVVPERAALLSAVGLDVARVERFAQRQVLASLEAVRDRIDGWWEALARDARTELERDGLAASDAEIRERIVDLRIAGQDATIAIRNVAPGHVASVFADRYRATFGLDPEGALEVVALRLVVGGKSDVIPAAPEEGGVARPETERRASFDGTWHTVPVVDRVSMTSTPRMGPLLVVEDDSTTVVEPGWTVRRHDGGALLLERVERRERSAAGAEAVTNELFTSRLESIADEMGQMLERTAMSVNVKQRLDFSCTVLDERGRLVVNAPHMPVHLGAMGLCVRAVMTRLDMNDGDVVLTNHPAYGGSHLPDLTVITAVGEPDDRIGFVASRAHHAEIGGTRPGSMPPNATSLEEEGVVFEPIFLVRRGETRWSETRDRLAGARYPSRDVGQNIADLRAQIAANHHGATALRAMARDASTADVRRRMDEICARGRRAARAALSAWPDGVYRAEQALDDGALLRVAIDVRGDLAIFDFDGSAPVHAGNLNATPAIVRSVVIYIMRLLIGERLPLNEGLMDAVEVRVPTGLLNPPFDRDVARCPAVVGGNVETSQRLVDTLLLALGLSAASQGTMNNTLFGNESFGYYETVCGGAGATPRQAGTSAIHTHMTNTRITDPEILEQRYPVRLERFEIREGSGGAGARRGGDGARREILFLEQASLSLLSQHRLEGPFGLDGGEAGAPGRQRVIRFDGSVEVLDGIDQRELEAGDRFVLETPGGGGHGQAVTDTDAGSNRPQASGTDAAVIDSSPRS